MGEPGTRETPRTLEELSTQELLSTLRGESSGLIATLDGVIRDAGKNLVAEDQRDLERLKALVEEFSRRTE